MIAVLARDCAVQRRDTRGVPDVVERRDVAVAEEWFRIFSERNDVDASDEAKAPATAPRRMFARISGLAIASFRSASRSSSAPAT